MKTMKLNYQQVVNNVVNGSKYYLDLPNNVLIIIIDNDPIQVELDKNFMELPDRNNIITKLESLFEEYLYSLPSDNPSIASPIFPVPRFDNIPEDKLNGMSRIETQVKLELYLLGLKLNGIKFKDLDNESNHWYYLNPKFNNLMIMRSWLDGEL